MWKSNPNATPPMRARPASLPPFGFSTSYDTWEFLLIACRLMPSAVAFRRTTPCWAAAPTYVAAEELRPEVSTRRHPEPSRTRPAESLRSRTAVCTAALEGIDFAVKASLLRAVFAAAFA